MSRSSQILVAALLPLVIGIISAFATVFSDTWLVSLGIAIIPLALVSGYLCRSWWGLLLIPAATAVSAEVALLFALAAINFEPTETSEYDTMLLAMAAQIFLAGFVGFLAAMGIALGKALETKSSEPTQAGSTMLAVEVDGSHSRSRGYRVTVITVIIAFLAPMGFLTTFSFAMLIWFGLGVWILFQAHRATQAGQHVTGGWPSSPRASMFVGAGFLCWALHLLLFAANSEINTVIPFVLLMFISIWFDMFGVLVGHWEGVLMLIGFVLVLYGLRLEEHSTDQGETPRDTHGATS